MNDDPPIDLLRVAADEAALEQLRTGAGSSSDPGLVLLRALLADVDKDLPVETPVSRGSTVISLAGEQTPDRRLARNGTLVALLAAGLVSLGGVAAASTLAPAGSPLHALGETVRSTAGAVVAAVSPPEPSAGSSAGGAAGSGVTPVRPVIPTAPPAARLSPPPGVAVADAVRSAAAARSAGALLDQAAALLAQDRLPAASARLDSAERRLAQVLPADRGPLSARLADLRDQVAAARAAEVAGPADAAPKKEQPVREQREKEPPAQKPAAPAPEPQGSTELRLDSTTPVERVAPRSERRTTPTREGQLSRAESLKPRA